MRIAVIGAGIIGMTTAYELATDGHEVTVFERRSSVAEESSFATAGLLSPGCAVPWAAPAMSRTVLRRLFAPHAALRFGSWPDATLMRWLLHWRRACRPAAHEASRAAMHRLAALSQLRLQAVSHALKLEYEQAEGVLVLLRGEAEVVSARRSLRMLAELGVEFHLVDAARCRQIEPGLDAQTPLRAGIHLPRDGVGNCRQFAHLLRVECQRLGVQLHFQDEVVRLVPGPTVTIEHIQRVGQAPDAAAPAAFDAVVLCAALGALPLLAPLGIRLPMVPIYGYSVTAPLRAIEGHPDFGPRAALVDERHQVAVSRLGQRIRVAGGAELGGSLDRLSPAPLATLYKVLHDWFPGAAQLAQAQHWKGARPTLPDGPPVLGACGVPGVWLNLGHGGSGWALACGSAQVVADGIAGRPAQIDLARLGWGRH